MNDVLDDINKYNKNRDKKVLIVFDDMIDDIEYNKNFKRIIKELFYRARKICSVKNMQLISCIYCTILF